MGIVFCERNCRLSPGCQDTCTYMILLSDGFRNVKIAVYRSLTGPYWLFPCRRVWEKAKNGFVEVFAGVRTSLHSIHPLEFRICSLRCTKALLMLRPSRGPFYGLVHLDDGHLTEQRGAAADPSLLDKLILTFPSPGNTIKKYIKGDVPFYVVLF